MFMLSHTFALALPNNFQFNFFFMEELKLYCALNLSLISGFGGGWDIISPAGWGMALWVGLVFRGCRAGGLREAISLSREMGTPLFNEPDTEAGQISNESDKKANLDAYFRYQSPSFSFAYLILQHKYAHLLSVFITYS